MVDPRIAKRRNEVHQQSAHTSVRRLMKWVLIGVALFGLAWFTQSSSFQVQELLVEGVISSNAEEILEQQGVILGRPLMRLRPAAAEEALLADPWVSEATVEVAFPNTVRVAVRERHGVGWVLVDGGYIYVASDGTALEAGADSGGLPTVSLGGVARMSLGTPSIDLRVVGIAEFLAELPSDIAVQSVVTEQEGELWVELVDLNVRVRLGRPVDMQRKAAALAGLVSQGIPQGSIVHLIAPERPAVEPPSPVEDS